ncbi:MAG: DUF1731 domain-containing protein [Chitinophagaceae bacterium]|nr:DUF1731 domain-containing protein [Chitinophagaceae bacterium]
MLGQRSIEVLKSATVSCKKIMNIGFKLNYDDIETALTDLAKNKITDQTPSFSPAPEIKQDKIAKRTKGTLSN